MSKKCISCNQNFIFSEKEQEILQKISPVFEGKRYDIPTPEECGRCRMRGIMTYLNEINLFKTTCAASGKEILTIYHPDSGYKVIENSIWLSDAFDALQYGREFNFKENFFSQFKKLKLDVPRMNISAEDLENSPFVSAAGRLKNCYMVLVGARSEDSYYDYFIWDSKDTMDSSFIYRMERSYWAIDSQNCFQCFFVQDCDRCNDSYFLYDCRGCTNCIGCSGLRNKEYYVFNKQVSKEEFEKSAAALKKLSFQELRGYYEKFLQFTKTLPKKYMRGEKNESVTGNYIYNSKEVERSYNMNECENCFDCMLMEHTKDSISVYQWGENSELIYNSIEIGTSQKIAFSTSSWKTNQNLLYCDYCMWCKDCFGCSGLKNKQYCIFNKQYTKEEYEELVPKIIEYMTSTGEWGKFFPLEDAPFAYNESVAAMYFPLSEEEILKAELLYRKKYPAANIQFDILASDRIADVDESILKKVLKCEQSGKPYRVISQEYAFYLKNSLPIPRISFEERHKERFLMRTPNRLFSRECDSCHTQLETAYEEEKVLCENCYLKIIG